MDASFRFFCNRACRYFPCHQDINPENFNCLFCYCPLYFTATCPGTPQWTRSGIKDCSGCTFPHQAENYPEVLKFLTRAIHETAKKTSTE